MWMPGTLTTTYGNRANDRQIEIYEVLQIFRHFWGGQCKCRREFVRARKIFLGGIDFSSENAPRRRERIAYEYFLDGKILRGRGFLRGETRAGIFRARGWDKKYFLGGAPCFAPRGGD